MNNSYFLKVYNFKYLQKAHDSIVVYNEQWQLDKDIEPFSIIKKSEFGTCIEVTEFTPDERSASDANSKKRCIHFDEVGILGFFKRRTKYVGKTKVLIGVIDYEHLLYLAHFHDRLNQIKDLKSNDEEVDKMLKHIKDVENDIFLYKSKLDGYGRIIRTDLLLAKMLENEAKKRLLKEEEKLKSAKSEEEQLKQMKKLKKLDPVGGGEEQLDEIKQKKTILFKKKKD